MCLTALDGPHPARPPPADGELREPWISRRADATRWSIADSVGVGIPIANTLETDAVAQHMDVAAVRDNDRVREQAGFSQTQVGACQHFAGFDGLVTQLAILPASSPRL